MGPVVFKLVCIRVIWRAWESRVSDAGGLGRGLGMCISRKSLDDADAAGLETAL